MRFFWCALLEVLDLIIKRTSPANVYYTDTYIPFYSPGFYWFICWELCLYSTIAVKYANKSKYFQIHASSIR